MSTCQSAPMWRLTELIVRSTLVTAWRLAISPTRTSSVLLKATTDGVVRAPSAFAMTVGSPPSSTLTTELVVPRSVPTALPMRYPPFRLVLEGSRLKFVVRSARMQIENLKLEFNRLNYGERPYIPGLVSPSGQTFRSPQTRNAELSLANPWP